MTEPLRPGAVTFKALDADHPGAGEARLAARSGLVMLNSMAIRPSFCESVLMTFAS